MSTFSEKLVHFYELFNQNLSIFQALQIVKDEFGDDVCCDRLVILLPNSSEELYIHASCDTKHPKLQSGNAILQSKTTLYEIFSSRKEMVFDDFEAALSQNSLENQELLQYILEEGILSGLACPLNLQDAVMGAILFGSSKKHIYTNPEIIQKSLSITKAVALLIERSIIADDLFLNSLIHFANIVEVKNTDTGKHVERMQIYSRIIANALTRVEKFKDIVDCIFVEDVYKFSALHDIGKVGIADGILFKPGKLTPEEFQVMKSHTTIGADILMKANCHRLQRGKGFFDMGIDIALGHHEKYNGSGYPFGVQGDQIPLAARIVTVADVFDALTSKRVYKSPVSMEISVAMILEERGKSFDPDVVDAFVESMDEIEAAYEKHKEEYEFFDL